jgi:hypothetical protein
LSACHRTPRRKAIEYYPKVACHSFRQPNHMDERDLAMKETDILYIAAKTKKAPN